MTTVIEQLLESPFHKFVKASWCKTHNTSHSNVPMDLGHCELVGYTMSTMDVIEALKLIYSLSQKDQAADEREFILEFVDRLQKEINRFGT